MLAHQEIQEIDQLIGRNETEAADKRLKSAAAAHQEDASWWLLRGKVAEKRGDRDQAAVCLEKAIALDPDNSEALFQLAYLADLHGDDELAMELYRQCTNHTPMHVNAMINLAVLLEDQGRYEQAKVYLEQVLKHHPNHKRAELFLRDVLSSMDMYYDEDLERNREKRNAVLDIPISDFELSVRSRNCLKKMDINSLGDLLKTTEAELLSYKNFGETSLNEIKAMLRQKGLRLGQALDDDQFKRTNLGLSVLAPVSSGGDPALLSTPVSELELSVRSRKCLQRLGISTLGELASRTEAELLSAKNFGQTSLDEIKQRLTASGLSLRKLDGRS